METSQSGSLEFGYIRLDLLELSWSAIEVRCPGEPLSLRQTRTPCSSGVTEVHGGETLKTILSDSFILQKGKLRPSGVHEKAWYRAQVLLISNEYIYCPVMWVKSPDY